MILSDTSVLSSFAAAHGLPLLLATLEETIFIPPAVEQELQAGLARGVTYLQKESYALTSPPYCASCGQKALPPEPKSRP